MFVYPATGEGVHSAVIVMPGGGYTHLAIEKEGGAEARWLNEHGVTAFVLEYRLGPRYHFPSPMLDGARAVRYVRSHAAELGVAKDRIGLWGFSAGGHLAGYLAAVQRWRRSWSDGPDRTSERPAGFCDCVVWAVQPGRYDSAQDEYGGAAGRSSDAGDAGCGLGGEARDEEYAAVLYFFDDGRSDGELDECNGVVRCVEDRQGFRRSCISLSVDRMAWAWRKE